jgi:hypothetical protein
VKQRRNKQRYTKIRILVGETRSRLVSRHALCLLLPLSDWWLPAVHSLTHALTHSLPCLHIILFTIFITLYCSHPQTLLSLPFSPSLTPSLTHIMRPLTDEEMRIFFEKLQSYIGNNIAKLIDRSDEPFTFRMIKDRVFYLSEAQMKLASNIGRENLLSIGTCFGKFTKNDKFRLHVSCLDYISQYAKVSVCVSKCVCVCVSVCVVLGVSPILTATHSLTHCITLPSAFHCAALYCYHTTCTLACSARVNIS